jgi:hypothetical protein
LAISAVLRPPGRQERSARRPHGAGNATALARGLALVSQGEVAAGMAHLDEATAAATAGEMSDPVAVGFSCC